MRLDASLLSAQNSSEQSPPPSTLSVLSSLPFVSLVRCSRGLYCRGHVDSISPFSRLGNKTLASIIYLHYRYFTPTWTRHVFMAKLFSIISRIWTRWEIRPTDRCIIRETLRNGDGEGEDSLRSRKNDPAAAGSRERRRSTILFIAPVPDGSLDRDFRGSSIAKPSGVTMRTYLEDVLMVDGTWKVNNF